MIRWFFSYWSSGVAPRGQVSIPAVTGEFGYYRTDPTSYTTEGECVAAAVSFRIRTGVTDIQIHKRGRGGRSSSYKLGDQSK